jgi:ABC-2 type transport system permease protein
MSNRILALIWKELLAVLRDPKSRFVLIVPPLIQLLIFAFAATLDVKNVSMGILNRDNGKQGFELCQRFHGAPTFAHITYLQSVEEIAPFIDTQKGVMVVSLDEQFSRNLDAGRAADVQLILDGRKSNTTQIVAGYATRIIDQYGTDLAAQQGLPLPNIQLMPRIWYNPNITYYWYNIPCLVGILSMLTCLVVTSMSVAREREMGTFDQLLVSPLTPVEIVIGKVVPGILIGLAEACFMFTMGVFVLQVPFQGEFLLLLLSLLVFVASISGFGLFISSLCATQQQALLGNFTFMVPSVLLSGFATPIENMPSWLQPITYLLPLRYMLVISKGLFLKQIPAAVVFSNLWPMALIAACTLIGASWFFRHRLE